MKPAGFIVAAVWLLGAAALQAQPGLAGCAMFPSNNIWNTAVDRLPVDANSAAYIASNGGTKSLHADFGSTWGIPFNVVPASQAAVSVSFTYADESDAGPYPLLPASLPPSTRRWASVSG
jgi:hypothetical protein